MPPPLQSREDEGFIDDALEEKNCRQTQAARLRLGTAGGLSLGAETTPLPRKNICFIGGPELWATPVIPVRGVQGLG